MSDWWKAPVLQGDDNEYGDYDYLIEELPQDYAKWELSRYTSRCDSCGKESHLVFRSVGHFHTLDGWDSMDYAECWKCRLESKVHSIICRFKKRIKAIKDAMDLYKSGKKQIDFQHCYELAKKLNK